MIMLLILDVHFLPILSPIILPPTFGFLGCTFWPHMIPLQNISNEHQIHNYLSEIDWKHLHKAWWTCYTKSLNVEKYSSILSILTYGFATIQVKKISRIMSSNSNANWVIQFNWGNMMHIHESFHSSFWGQWRLVWTDISGSTDLDLKSFHL